MYKTPPTTKNKEHDDRNIKKKLMFIHLFNKKRTLYTVPIKINIKRKAGIKNF